MKIPIVKQLVEKYKIEDLQKAEEDLAEEREPAIEIGGEDEGEQLTHAYAAIQIKQAMKEGKDFKSALREYTSRVRSSIS